MFNPPSADNWCFAYSYEKRYLEAYREGYKHAQEKGKEDDNPYTPSGHERETTWEDDMNYFWYSGFWDYEEKI